jgi:hypothetical protein
MSVALLYSSWRAYCENIVAKQRMVRERVAYMLWVVASRVPESE